MSVGAVTTALEGRRQYHLGVILVTASAVAWSTAGLFTRMVPYDAWTMLVWRGLFAALGILLFMGLLDRRSIARDFARMGWPGWTFAVVSAVGMLMFISSFRHTSVAHVAIIYATVPFIAAGLGWLILRERPSKTAVAASLAALAGVVVMVGSGSGEGGWVGDVLALGMTFVMAAMMIIARRYKDIPMMPAACLSALISATAAIPFADALSVTGPDFLTLAAFGVVNSAIGLGLFTLGSRLLPPMETALIGSLDAPLAPLLVWLFYAETPSPSTIYGGTVVFIAVLARRPLDEEDELVSR